jgi:hypothetical protein
MRRTLAVLAVATVALTTVMAGTGPSDAAKRPLRYVALGDSYSAASGLLPPDPSGDLPRSRTARRTTYR